MTELIVVDDKYPFIVANYTPGKTDGIPSSYYKRIQWGYVSGVCRVSCRAMHSNSNTSDVMRGVYDTTNGTFTRKTGTNNIDGDAVMLFGGYDGSMLIEKTTPWFVVVAYVDDDYTDDAQASLKSAVTSALSSIRMASFLAAPEPSPVLSFNYDPVKMG